MSDIKTIWNPIHIKTGVAELILIELSKKYDTIVMDYGWGKILGDDEIIFEFNPNEINNYTKIGTLHECYENDDLLINLVDSKPTFEELFETPTDDIDTWEKVNFTDENGKKYLVRGKEFSYRKQNGQQYVNYGIPEDVQEYFLLNDPIDSFITLLRSKNIHQSNIDYLILSKR